jgi:Zn-dependent protease
LNLNVLGVAVEVDRSWYTVALIIALAFAWSIYTLIPEVGPAGALGLGVMVALALSASLLAHELAHARVSINAGIEVEHVRIFAGGALCRRREPIEVPRTQFLVAAAGPLTSVAIGIAALAISFAADLAGLSQAVSASLWFVAFANVLIAVSNMLPVFPFDGSKVLHAMFWRSTGDREVATARLKRSGREFSRIVISLGIIVAAWGGELLLGFGIAAFGFYLTRLPVPE